MKRCAYCGREQQDDGTNCAECGAKLAISPPLSQRPMKASSRALMLAACVAIVLIFAGILTPWPAAKGDWLTLRFIGLTNLSSCRHNRPSLPGDHQFFLRVNDEDARRRIWPRYIHIRAGIGIALGIKPETHKLQSFASGGPQRG